MKLYLKPEPEGNDETLANLAEAALGQAKYKVANGRRTTRLVDQAFDRHVGSIANSVNTKRKANSETLGTSFTRATPADALKGMYNADEEFLPTQESVSKLASQVANIVGHDSFISLNAMENLHMRLAKHYVETKGMDKFVSLSDISDDEVAETILENETDDDQNSAAA